MSVKKLEIEFINDYLSFKKGEKFTFEGNFIILSGLNGTGKTQLLNAITDRYTLIKQNNRKIKNTEIKLLSFEENIKYKSFDNFKPQYLREKIDDIFTFYKSITCLKSPYDSPRDSLDKNNPMEAEYLHKDGVLYKPLINNWQERWKLIEIIKDKTNKGIRYFLTRDQIQDILPLDFEWTIDNRSTRDKLFYHVYHVFLSYVQKIHSNKLECINHKDKSLTTKKFDDEYWKKNAPWTKLNHLFEKLEFKYRFLEDYQLDIISGKLNEKFILIDKKNNKTRHLSDLSDGEKTLLDLALNSFDFKGADTKLILFDEYDAFLNPSIISKVFIIFEELYKDIQIVFVTHNLTSIFQAPKGANFYEIFLNKSGTHEIQSTSPDLYKDVRCFLDSLKIDDRLDLLKCKLFIISEGHNKKHFEHILYNVYHVAERGDFYIIDGRGKGELFDNYDVYEKFGKKFLFVWDPDPEITEDFISKQFMKHNVKNDNKNFKFKFKENDNSKLTRKENKGIESLYDYDEKAWKNCSNNKKIDKIKTIKYVLKQTDPEFFKKFEPFVNEVKKILQQN